MCLKMTTADPFWGGSKRVNEPIGTMYTQNHDCHVIEEHSVIQLSVAKQMATGLTALGDIVFGLN